VTGSARHEIGGVDGEFRPIRCLDLELTDASAAGWQDAEPRLALLRVHGAPVAQLLLEAGDGADLAALLTRLSTEAREVLGRHLVADALVSESTLPSAVDDLVALVGSAGPSCASDDAEPPTLPVSVIVCTLGREPLLRACLESLRDQDHVAFEVVVVDNDPASGAVAALLADLDDAVFHYVAQPIKGLSNARNAGLAAARHDVVAFTDDDAIADRDWIRRLATVFAQDRVVSAVTGLVVPWELETQAQLWFEQFGSFDRGCRRQVWAYPESRRYDALGPQGDGGPAYPFSAGVIGSGNNMAFRRERVRVLGGFDAALGAGTITGGGEDLDIYVRLLLAGDVIVYEPRAVVRHRHRREMSALTSQTWFYGAGLTAMLMKTIVTEPSVLWSFARRVPAGTRRMLDPGSEKNAGRGRSFPSELTTSERRGFVAGPYLYVRSRWITRKA
jgi:glycosyltransferase involved in cell wall biosynthesis